ncbi:MBL fold metallo-hydrolase [Flavobacterium sp. NRK F10]|uniref:MBL fold metallo-hydrolase n=1 Tax=Flavobacterium sp. NRK F10 TaxID=2954931 RepID=UPI0020919724|nr:MBL fold metallo-hydrolase [Flavobacterium sp. NRK F10]MCO6175923.1 MBL fold metallo-hydrolase [Flavobacterium sp. NRK F10]
MKPKYKKILKRMFYTIAIIIAVVFIIGVWFLNQPQFGKAPSGEHLERIKKSPNYKNGKFQNINNVPLLSEGHSFFGLIRKAITEKYPDKVPSNTIKSVKTNLKTLKQDEDFLVWFGHSSYYIQIDKKRFLVDPVFSGNASPIPGNGKAFEGSNEYQVSDLPYIDYLLITHDHYDHLDYETILKLKDRVGKVICGLGVASHLEYWGFNKNKIIEKDWYETEYLTKQTIIHTTPTQHFSGRSIFRNNTLWLSFVIQTPNYKIYVGGDSGYSMHFKEIGEKFGPFDLAILENGQYNKAWESIHLLPEQVLKAALDLRAKRLLPVHSSKFRLSTHPWYEPLEMVTGLHKKEKYDFDISTPIIGEKLDLKSKTQSFYKWWESNMLKDKIDDSN